MTDLSLTSSSRQRQLLAVTLLGFASGLPYYVQVTLLPAWLRSHGVGLTEIALLSWTRLPYVWKFLWAPLLDRYRLPFLSRRRDWILLSQLLISGLIVLLGRCQPGVDRAAISVLALMLGFLGATQDVAIDAYRRDILSDEDLGMGNALGVNAYRAAGAIAGGLALLLADHIPWPQVYAVVAACMIIGVLGVYFAPLVSEAAKTETLAQAYLSPLLQLLRRQPAGRTLEWLLFLVTYKLGDCLATSLLTPFYLDCGFSLTEIGTTVKATSLSALICGSLLAGFLMTRISLRSALLAFGSVQALAILSLALLAVSPPSVGLLASVVLCEYVGMSLSTTAFLAFLAQATSRTFSATQYAWLSSLVSLPQLAASSSAGWLVAQLGYPRFFVLCTLISVPGLLLAVRVTRSAD